MCMSCGCGDVNDDHGNPDNITLNVMQKAASAANLNIEQAANHIHHAARRYRDQNQAAVQAAGPRPATASGARGRPGDTPAGGNYRTGDLPGTPSAAPRPGGLTGAVPGPAGLADPSLPATDPPATEVETGQDPA